MSWEWLVDSLEGPANDLFAESFDDWPTRSVRILTANAPTIVLGAAQSPEIVCLDEARRSGVDVVKRRSGGGAVWLDGDMTWIDVVLRKDDSLWCEDVGRAFLWLGDCWVTALRSLVAGPSELSAHEGALVQSPWSRLVCFGGLGPGEVSLTGRKLVGVAQKRTRNAALFQCGVLHAWNPSELLRFLVPTQDVEVAQLAAEDLMPRCTTVPRSGVVEAFVSALHALDS